MNFYATQLETFNVPMLWTCTRCTVCGIQVPGRRSAPAYSGEGSSQPGTRSILQVPGSCNVIFVVVVWFSVASFGTYARAGGMSEPLFSSKTCIFSSQTSCISGGYRYLQRYIDQPFSRTTCDTTSMLVNHLCHLVPILNHKEHMYIALPLAVISYFLLLLM